MPPKQTKKQGYGIYTWPNGDVFMGQWVDEVRHGGGIFRSADGREYIGAWAGNVREGHGVREQPAPPLPRPILKGSRVSFIFGGTKGGDGRASIPEWAARKTSSRSVGSGAGGT